jgi:hypothetical protein
MLLIPSAPFHFPNLGPFFICQGQFYASKDNLYPTLKGGSTRRINWGWATVPPASTQSLPREITFNAAARQLAQYPIDEIKKLRGAASIDKTVLVQANVPLDLVSESGVAKQSEIMATFTLPEKAGKFGVTIGTSAAPSPSTPVGTFMASTDMPGGDYSVTHHAAPFNATVCEAMCDKDAKCRAWTWVIRGSPAHSGDCCLKTAVMCPHKNVGSCTSGAKTATTIKCGGAGATGITCSIDYTPPAPGANYTAVPVSCGAHTDTLHLTPGEKTVEIRAYSDATFVEAFFGGGRAAITTTVALDDDSHLGLTSTTGITVDATVYPIRQIWTTPDAVRAAPQVYHWPTQE